MDDKINFFNENINILIDLRAPLKMFVFNRPRRVSS